ncbi:MAG: hypothetical protein LBC95_02785 [Candidatus Nomurabacteria bacterium]|jgi:NADH:ubiquinone oxidoreductase subunit 6 (subunit J)|nr:hypothetical protein [Candidatus Nomurabacteria bacterium]
MKQNDKPTPQRVDQIKSALRETAKSRVFVTLWVVIILQALLLLILVLTIGRIGEPGVPVRHNGFECATCVNSENGSYLLNFVFLAAIIPVVNILVSLKLYTVRGRNIALVVLWLTMAVFAVATVFTLALLNRGNIL